MTAPPPPGAGEVFTKTSPTAPAGFYEVEAAGLRWLAAAGPAAARTVGVVEVGDHHISLERLHPAAPTREAATAFGRALALTHAAGACAFGQGPDGWSGDGWIGQQPMTLQPVWPDRPVPWGTFYAEQRLLPYARRARERGNLSVSALRTVERVAERLKAGTWDDGRPPSRIHGDLWAGNVVYTARGVVLIDPAAHGGHALTDLAMLHLFGAPHLSAVTSAYAEAAGLTQDWAELIGLHQLHPLLVHAASHGPSYGAEAAAVASRYL